MNNFSSLQVTASFLLVIIGMIYYKAPEDGMVTECGSLLPDWKSVSAIFSLYTIVFILMFLANVWFIQHTRRQAATEVPTWVIFTHPALRLVLCKYQYYSTVVVKRLTSINLFSFIRLLYHLRVRLPALRSPEGDHPAVCDPHLYVGGPAHPHRRRRLPHVLHVLRLQEGDRVDEDGN